ncbi:Ferredoxin subunit of nitrite reductase or a ring-hydroxylating dioxygenase [Actinopolyspora mzabensis]|uniref:Cytochrome bc1 complex Rieske iron-sulfur subunit n=1 Tax=Actinopolyspora mzabensis TaxID=995066 RepID=A0A1G9DMB2_ACTMZ|nr:Rieske (2Fe-2S) protein [Actinopolyspora mzabensis]SDK65009.1 Ferredoxin subunit of nitrite reductase or a ring-hydroxylating dioxygenase [Actinopolyspora mzabensis]
MSSERATSRRRFLITGGAVAGATALSGCGDGSYSGSSLTTTEEAGSSTGESPKQDSALARVDEVPVGGALITEGPENEQIALAQPSAGEFTAHSAVCTHMGCTVRADGDQLRCPCHNSVFESATGEVVSGPARTALPGIAVHVEGERIVTGED